MTASVSLKLRMVTAILCSLQHAAYAPSFIGVTEELPSNVVDHPSVNVTTYWGIRYALPPVGDLRFKPPVLYNYGANETHDRKTPPPACIQEARPGSHVSTVGTSEDCLFLNIWQPQCYTVNRNIANTAVLVWIHGGGLQKDTSSNPLYNGARYAAWGCTTVVSVNYRLGVFGFLHLGHPDVPGNMGLLDVKTALTWIQKNIDDFRGRKYSITLAGNWAGAYIASTFLMASSTWDLFNNAILQSGAPTTPGFHQDRLTARRLAGLLAARLGCLRFTNAHVAECLRKVNVNRLQEAYVRLTRETKTSMVSVTDGHFLVKDPVQYLMEGAMKKCNIIVGDNAREDEYILKTALPHVYNSLLFEASSQSSRVLNALLNVVITKYSKSSLLPSILSTLKAIYHHNNIPAETPRRLQIMSAISRELVLGCPILLLANTYAKMSQKVFVYSFNYTSKITESLGLSGATYRSEIPYIFESFTKQNESAQFTEYDELIIGFIRMAWFNFQNHQTASDDFENSRYFWPIYDRNSPQLIEFTPDGDRKLRPLDTSFCDYWNSNPSRAWNQELFLKAVAKYGDVFEGST